MDLPILIFESNDMGTRFQTNEIIGDYRVAEFMGRGGMGEVYRFYHEKLNRSVAVKVLGNNVLTDAKYKERFLNEARLQASLHHPNIAELYDFKQIGSELLIFMEFVSGEGLDSLIERRALSTEESLEIFESIVESIAYVHSNGIVHRDIKTDNIKISDSGTPKLLDFGIAKDPSSLNMTEVGGVIGTPNYLAPELLEGRGASPQTDIWALGVLLYKMLTDRFPFEGERIEILVLHIAQGSYEPPETLNPAIPTGVSKVIKKCLNKDLSQRYNTAEELSKDVRQVLNERYSVETGLVSSPQWGLGFRGRWFAVAAVALCAFGLIATVIWATSGRTLTAGVESQTREARQNDDSKAVAVERKSDPPAVRSVGDGNARTVRIDAIGGSAEVWRDGRKLGNTPLDMRIGASEVIMLTLRRSGYEDGGGQVSASKKTWTFALRRK